MYSNCEWVNIFKTSISTKNISLCFLQFRWWALNKTILQMWEQKFPLLWIEIEIWYVRIVGGEVVIK